MDEIKCKQNKSVCLVTTSKPNPMKDVYCSDELAEFMHDHYGFGYGRIHSFLKEKIMFCADDMMQEIQDPEERKFFQILASTIGGDFLIFHV